MGPDNSPPQIVPLNSNNKKGPDTDTHIGPTQTQDANHTATIAKLTKNAKLKHVKTVQQKKLHPTVQIWHYIIIDANAPFAGTLSVVVPLLLTV